MKDTAIWRYSTTPSITSLVHPNPSTSLDLLNLLVKANEEIRCFNDFVNRLRKRTPDKRNSGQTTAKEKRKKQRKSKDVASKKTISSKEAVEEGNVTNVSESLHDGGSGHSLVSSGSTAGESASASTVGTLSERHSGESLYRARPREERKKTVKTVIWENNTTDEHGNDVTQSQPDKPSSKITRRDDDSFDITHEVELLREIKDIRDELDILRNLFSQQQLVLKPFARIMREARQKDTITSGDTANIPNPQLGLMAAIDRHVAYVSILDINAERLYRHV